MHRAPLAHTLPEVVALLVSALLALSCEDAAVSAWAEAQDAAPADAASQLADAAPSPTDAAPSPTDAAPPPTDAAPPPTDAAPPPTDAAPPLEDPRALKCLPSGAPECEGLGDYTSGEGLRAPIVLVHGFFGWRESLTVDYFYRVPRHLHDAGFPVYVAELDPINHSAVRAEQLKGFVDRVTRCACKERVNIIAHSQGGIDARYLLGPLDFAHRVSSITTISSPHRGFELAELGARAEGVGLTFLEGLTAMLSWLIRGAPEQPSDLRATLSSMSLTERAAYNEEWPDPPGVQIDSYVGITNPLVGGGALCERGVLPAPPRGDITEPALLTSYWLLGGLGTPNDGVVTAESGVWGRFMGCLPADHFDQVGQVLGVTDFDHLEFYLGVARRLAGEGL